MTTATFWNLITWIDATDMIRKTTADTTGRPLSRDEAESFIERGGRVDRVEFGFL
ncbi:hypothetical protein [Limnothrix sp. PR1529]|uniref:hypothetical protein n=1 Tax=Limnothrix sp. PR1529 TaxID=1704291 RepID=UPI0013046896|nr:hypothetical protein [Limnothrix sp. PR1529]